MEVHPPIIAPQDADKTADDIRDDSRTHTGFKADERRLIRGGAHIRRQHIQFTGKVRTGMFLVVLQNAQDIPAGGQFLVDGRHETRQFTLHQFHSGLAQLIRPAALLEISEQRQYHHQRCQDGQDQKARNDSQQDEAGLQNGVSRIDLGGHIQACGSQLRFQPSALVGIQADQRSQLQRPSQNERLHRFHKTALLASCGDEGTLCCQPGDLQHVRQNEIQSSSQGGAKQK